MGKKDKEKKGDEEGLPSTEFMIKPETATPKLDTSKYVSILRVCACRRCCWVVRMATAPRPRPQLT